MPGDFLDTSALAKHYHPEAGSAETDRLWNDPGRDLYVSRLSALEIVSAFAGKVRAGVISLAEFDALRRRFAADLTKNMIGPKKLSTIHAEIRAAAAREKENPIHALDRRIRKLKRNPKAAHTELKSLLLVRNARARALESKPQKRGRPSRAKRARGTLSSKASES